MPSSPLIANQTIYDNANKSFFSGCNKSIIKINRLLNPGAFLHVLLRDEDDGDSIVTRCGKKHPV